MSSARLVWHRPGNLSRGEFEAEHETRQCPAWADAPDGGRYHILGDGGDRQQAWVIYADGRWPVELARGVSGHAAWQACVDHKNATT